MKPLFVFGASTLARLAHHYATRELALNVAGFVVDDAYAEAYAEGALFLALPVYGWSAFLATHSPADVLLHVAIGYRDMRARAAAYDAVRANGFETINIVSRAAYLADGVALGTNNLLMPGAVIEPGVVLGSNNVVWSNAAVCHDCVIGNHNFLAANTTIGGGVHIGDGNFLGFSAVVMQGRTIGNQTLIGAQSLVRTDTRDLHQYHGVPAALVRAIDPERGVRVD